MSVAQNMTSEATSFSSSIDDAIFQGLPAFDGSDFDAWLAHFENVVLSRGEDSLPLPAVKRLLTVKLGPRHTAVARAVQTLSSWAAIKDLLNNKFSATPSQLDMALSWTTLTLGDRTLSEYHDVIVQMMHRQHTEPARCFDPQTVLYYLRGLHDFDLQKRLLGMLRKSDQAVCAKSLADYMKIAEAREYDTRLARTLLASAPPVSTTSPSFKPETYVAAAAAARPSFPTPPPGQIVLDPEVQCYRHPGADHPNQNCRFDKDVCPYCKQRVGQQALKEGHVKLKCTAPQCTICHRRGHATEQCYRRAEHATQAKPAPTFSAASSSQKRRSSERPGRSGSTRRVKHVKMVELYSDEEAPESGGEEVLHAEASPPTSDAPEK